MGIWSQNDVVSLSMPRHHVKYDVIFTLCACWILHCESSFIFAGKTWQCFPYNISENEMLANNIVTLND